MNWLATVIGAAALLGLAGPAGADTTIVSDTSAALCAKAASLGLAATALIAVACVSTIFARTLAHANTNLAATNVDVQKAIAERMNMELSSTNRPVRQRYFRRNWAGTTGLFG